jgi:hypothetical protein
MNSVPDPVNDQAAIPQVNAAMEAVLTTYADQLAHPTGLIKRQGKLRGQDFARLLVLGFLQNPQSSLEELAQFAESLGVQITSQGIDDRWSEDAATFFKALFEVALAQVGVADPVAVPLLSRFAAVVLEDSTQLRLLDERAEPFRGSGSVPGKGAQACAKLQVRLDMLAGHLTCSQLLPGVSADTRTPLAAVPTVARTLHIRDRGFFDLERICREAGQEQYHLTYFKTGVLLFDATGRALDLALLMAERKRKGEQGAWEMPVLVGERQVPMRLLVSPIPAEMASKRRGVLRQAAQKHSKAINHQSFLLADYDLVLTNVPPHLLSLPEALVLLHLRWQIELLFKLWKQHGLLDQWRTHNRWRVLCEVYAKLIGLLIQHWMLVVFCWHEPHRSLVKAAKAIRLHAILLAYAFAGELPTTWVLSKIQRMADRGSRLNSRQSHPNTSQHLLGEVPRPVPLLDKEGH